MPHHKFNVYNINSKDYPPLFNISENMELIHTMYQDGYNQFKESLFKSEKLITLKSLF